ncbi:hypothetical protein [Noviherbaspirillum autotrophicum]|uniref:Uncharacterized protein n=1 Tax=Noviherbaspirillum autotrophicum TaxID=709839 RepID=A0A0C1Y8M5_9BURK|nr:hypothetical protein [Noviherbaspirillum autotrophicum]KIF83288.1 hypothetical protein TSA66_24590 [Noviherbaspirillum autotrophicum]
MLRHHPALTAAQATRLARGCYCQIRLRCALLGFLLCLTVALAFLDSVHLAFAFAAAAGLPLGVAVLVPALGMLTLKLLESGYGCDIARRARQWARDAAAGDVFDLAAIQRESAADLLQAIRPRGSIPQGENR